MHGDRRGRELGFPTANIATAPHTALPADGVYAGRFAIGERPAGGSAAAAAGGGLGGHQPDVLRAGAHRRGLRARRRRGLLRLRGGGGLRAPAARPGALRPAWTPWSRRCTATSRAPASCSPGERSREFSRSAPRRGSALRASPRMADASGGRDRRRGSRENRERQRELYGAPLGDRVRRLTGALRHLPGPAGPHARAQPGDAQPAGERAPGQDRRPGGAGPDADARPALPRHAHARPIAGGRRRAARRGRARPAGAGMGGRRAGRARRAAHGRPPGAAERHRTARRPPCCAGSPSPARLAAAAAALGPAFPELAEVLRQAAGRPGGRDARVRHRGW